MSETENEPSAIATTNCCASYEKATAATCALCNAPICGNCSEIVENNKICIDCYVKVLEEQLDQDASPKDIPLAIIGGLLGSLLGASLWVAVYVMTNIMLGIAAIGVGYLAGHGVSLIVGKRKAYFLQVISAIFAFLGVLIGYTGIFVYILHQRLKSSQIEASYYNVRLWWEAIKILPENLGFFSWLFVAISIYYSWRISEPSKDQMPKPN